MARDRLAAAYLAHAAGALVDPAALEQRLVAAVTTGRAAAPDVEVDDERFAAYVATCVPATGELLAELDRRALANLYLAYACAVGAPRALEAFNRAFARDLAAALGSMGIPLPEREDVLQVVREKLFVGAATGRPKIHDYDGRGPIYPWLRVITVRVALDARRRHVRETPLDEAFLAELPADQTDPALAHLKVTYRADLRAAVAHAAAALSSKERNLLRYQVLDGLSIDEIGRLYDVHRATAARWIGRAREALASAARRDLRQRLHLEAVELDSVVRLLDSQLDFTLSRIFDPTTGPG